MSTSRNTIVVVSIILLALAVTIVIEGPAKVFEPLFGVFGGIFDNTLDTPNVVLLLLDTVRADHLGCYGYNINTSPGLDSLAYSGIMYRDCQAQASWTLPSMTSIFTGVSERAHRVNTTRDGFMNGVPEDYEMLPELMKDCGYETYAIFNVPVLDQCYGFWQGIDHIEARGCTLTIDANVVVDLALNYLDERDNEDGFFMIMHFFDAHYPYWPPEPYWATVQLDYPGDNATAPSTQDVNEAFLAGQLYDQIPFMIMLYDAEIFFMDNEITRFLRELRARGLADNTIVIAMADHGEEFGEHGRLFHGKQLFQETIHVPWIMAGPGIGEGLAVNGVVGQFDLLPTLGEIIGFDIPDYVEGLIALPEMPAHQGVPSSGFMSGGPDQAVIRFNNAKVFWAPDFEPLAFDLDMGMERDSSIRFVDEELANLVADYWATPIIFQPIRAQLPSNRGYLLRDLGYM